MKKIILAFVVIVSCFVMFSGLAFANNIDQDDKGCLNDAITTRRETFYNMKTNPQKSDKYFHEYLKKLRYIIQYMDSDIQYTDEEIKNKRALYSQIDIMFDCLNEFYYPSVDYNSILKNFAPVLSKAYKDYLKMMKTQKYTTMEDQLIIPFDELRKRIIAIEWFIEKNPEFVEIDSLHEDLADNLRIYMDGIGTSDMAEYFRGVDERTKQEIIRSYKLFLKDDWNKRFDFYRIIQRNYEEISR